MSIRVIAGEWGGRVLSVPPGRKTRPTPERVREAWMSVMASYLPGARVLDLFAGSGALGLEALSRGAASAVFVEESGPALKALRSNISALGAGELAAVVRGDALDFLEGVEPGAFDLALADPPYELGLAAELVRAFGQRPFARILAVEHRRNEELTAPPGAAQRRYGDTSITFIFAQP
ncbi:MAG: 16S rRNA (guanine(966)-N(2))-methyltransferase RsmD [Longimicrobiaceae bacterium]